MSPLLGVIAGAIIYFTQKENPFLSRHGKYIIIVAVIVWVIGIVVVMGGFLH
ncbi:MAG: hypothetical protein J6P09_09805 [Methanobrevibacter sp.]|nr:hypothetical protein [Methanobrevibacter sp.]MBO6124119.1 hypothetical protein [Methanobrevibacter sp.]MBP3791361.1 hypothetical protein [Methanobrevibacter sp.]